MDATRPTAPPAPTTPAFRERLLPGAVGWLAVVGIAVFAVIALVPVALEAAAVAGVVTLVAGVVVAVRTAPVVEVAGGELRAGAAHIPVALLGAPRVLDRDGVRAALGPGSDARTYACLRAWVPGAVVVDVHDPADPTPAWLVSSRRPGPLAAALTAAQARAGGPAGAAPGA